MQQSTLSIFAGAVDPSVRLEKLLPAGVAEIATGKLERMLADKQWVGPLPGCYQDPSLRGRRYQYACRRPAALGSSTSARAAPGPREASPPSASGSGSGGFGDYQHLIFGKTVLLRTVRHGFGSKL